MDETLCRVRFRWPLPEFTEDGRAVTAAYSHANCGRDAGHAGRHAFLGRAELVRDWIARTQSRPRWFFEPEETP